MRLAAFAAAFVSLTLSLASSAVSAEMIGGNPGPQHNYICPHADGQPPLECFLDAVQHLYTMCRNVKSIEIIEFGYEKSTEGTNGAKSDSCLDKQKQNIARPYQAALKEAKKSKSLTERLQSLHEMWLAAMSELKWKSGESDDAYKTRVAKPYEDFRERITLIRTTLASDGPAPGATQQPAVAEKTKPGKTKQQAKAKPN